MDDNAAIGALKHHAINISRNRIVGDVVVPGEGLNSRLHLSRQVAGAGNDEAIQRHAPPLAG